MDSDYYYLVNYTNYLKGEKYDKRGKGKKN